MPTSVTAKGLMMHLAKEPFWANSFRFIQLMHYPKVLQKSDDVCALFQQCSGPGRAVIDLSISEVWSLLQDKQAQTSFDPKLHQPHLFTADEITALARMEPDLNNEARPARVARLFADLAQQGLTPDTPRGVPGVMFYLPQTSLGAALITLNEATEVRNLFIHREFPQAELDKAWSSFIQHRKTPLPHPTLTY